MAEKEKTRLTGEGLKKLWRLYRFIKPYRIQYSIGLLFLLGSSAVSLIFPKVVGDLVDASTTGKFLEDIRQTALFLFVILFLQAFTSYFRIILFVNVTERTLADIRKATFDHLLRLPMRFYLGRRVGELNSRISSDITLLQDAMTTTLAEFIRQIIVIFGGITFLVFTSWKLTLFMLSIVPVVMILVVVFGRYIRKLSKKAQNEVAESNTIVEENLQGIQSVKAFTTEFFESARYSLVAKQIATTGMKNGKMRGAFSSFTILALFGAVAVVIWKGASLIGSGELDTGKFISFLIYTLFIAGSIGGMASVFGRVQKVIGATENLFEIFDEETEEIQKVSEIPNQYQLNGNITAKNLTFAYPSRPDSNVLNGINLSIKADQLVAVVGSSGAGKTTFASLLLRLYEPTLGKLLFDNVPGDQIPLSVLRAQTALVPQDIYLFGGTIRENIAYGKIGATDEEIISAAQKANAWEFISQFSEGLDTLVGERGTQLSGGQRQRIAIARALLKNPKILILDEATSSLDSESEKLVQDALDELMKGRTSIVIAHRLSTIRKADKILVLEKGKIVEEGTHEQLIKLDGGVYKGLSELQFAI